MLTRVGPGFRTKKSAFSKKVLNLKEKTFCFIFLLDMPKYEYPRNERRTKGKEKEEKKSESQCKHLDQNLSSSLGVYL